MNGKGGELRRTALADEVGVLPTDVLHEVFLHLPANVLCRLRLVCRSWRSLTSDPTFAEAHKSRHPLIVSLADCRREVQFVDLSGNTVKRISTGQAWDIRHMSTDLDLLCVSQEHGETCVIDPITGCVTDLKNNQLDAEHNKGRVRTIFSVLGHVPSTGEYKVLRIHWYSRGDAGPEQGCDIVTLGGNNVSWRLVPGPPVRISASLIQVASGPEAGKAVVVKGVVYFQVHPDPDKFKPGDVVSFDLGTEVSSRTMYRGPLNNGGCLCACAIDDKSWTMKQFYLAQMKGCLVQVILKTLAYGDRSMDLWFSEDLEKGLWNKRYSLHYEPISFDNGFVSPVKVLDDAKILTWEHWKRVLRACDPRTHKSIDLAKVETKYHNIVVYQGSLLCSGDFWE